MIISIYASKVSQILNGTQLEKNCRNGWKEHLKISKSVTKFIGHMLKMTKI